MIDTPGPPEARISVAEREHALRLAWLKSHRSALQTYTRAAMRAPALAAAGSLIAALAFVTVNQEGLLEDGGTLGRFDDAVSWLVASLLLAVASPGLAALSELMFAESVGSEKFVWTYPYVHRPGRSKVFRAGGWIARALCVLAVVGSVICLTAGALEFLRSVR